MVDLAVTEAIAALPCWSGSIEITPLCGGLTNSNFLITDGSHHKYVVREGRDIPAHGIMRFNELAAARAAFAAGIGPEVVHASSGFMVSRYVVGTVLTPELIRTTPMLKRICSLLQRCHGLIPRYFQGPALIFWVFQVIRSYLARLEQQSEEHHAKFAGLREKAQRLEVALGPVSIVFGHNDLLAANLIDDGNRLWLIDWDYAGFNSPLFDLANLASNNQLSRDYEELVLESYFGASVTRDLRRGFDAMLCASLLRETLWAAVSGPTSTISFDYSAYEADYRQRFDRQWEQFEKQYG